MKIVNFTPGLGNQIFEYIFVEYLRRMFPDQQIYGYYNAKTLHKHNGLEVHKVFDITLPEHNLWSDSVVWLCRKLNGIGVKGFKATDSVHSERAIYYDGWWQDKKFFLDTVGKIRFRDFELDEKNKALLDSIQNSQSVFIHIRRGDYLAPEHIATYGGICTDEYYRKAIDIIKDKMQNPHFFVFSNDISWVMENMEIPNPTYVDNNTGKKSFLDMYLMTNCKAGILANSSFSYWGGMLNKNTPIIIYPGKWDNRHTPDIFIDSWMAL